MKIASHSTFRGLIEGPGFTFAPLSVDPQAVVESLARSGGSATGIMKGFRRVVEPALYEAAGEVVEASKDPDALLISSAAFLGYDVADARGLPPLIGPTSHFPSTLMPASIGLAGGGLRNLGALYNRSTHLAEALGRAPGPGHQQNHRRPSPELAAHLGEKISREDSMARAVDLIIQRFLSKGRIA